MFRSDEGPTPKSLDLDAFYINITPSIYTSNANNAVNKFCTLLIQDVQVSTSYPGSFPGYDVDRVCGRFTKVINAASHTHQ